MRRVLDSVDLLKSRCKLAKCIGLTMHPVARVVIETCRPNSDRLTYLGLSTKAFSVI
jgi:hypothetical protein